MRPVVTSAKMMCHAPSGPAANARRGSLDAGVGVSGGCVDKSPPVVGRGVGAGGEVGLACANCRGVTVGCVAG